MALGTAFGGALVLSQIFGVQTHADLLLLLAIVAGIAFVFEKVALAGVFKGLTPRLEDDASDHADAAGDAGSARSRRCNWRIPATRGRRTQVTAPRAARRA